MRRTEGRDKETMLTFKGRKDEIHAGDLDRLKGQHDGKLPRRPLAVEEIREQRRREEHLRKGSSRVVSKTRSMVKRTFAMVVTTYARPARTTCAYTRSSRLRKNSDHQLFAMENRI